MISNDATALLRDRKYMYNCALKDAHGDVQACKKNLDEIEQKDTEFMRNQAEVWGREALQDVLRTVVTRKGRLVFILGGKSTGKSLVIKSLEKLNMDSVFVVDLRKHRGDMLQGLLAILDARRSHFEAERGLVSYAARVFQTIFATWFPNPPAIIIIEGLVTGLTKILENENAKKSLNDLIQNLIKVKGGKITIIIDEANMAFTAEKGDEAKNDLAVFTQLTKQDQQV